MLENQALISVIVPIYNVEKFIIECIDSIINQTYSNLEIILVDDGSRDRCPEICNAYSRKDSRIKVIHQPNKGVSAARNAGIRAAKGKYISFVDGDDYLLENAIELLYGSIANDASLGVVAARVYLINGKERTLWGTANEEVKYFESGELITSVLSDSFLGTVWGKIYDGTLIKHCLLKEGIYNEDNLHTYYYAKLLATKGLRALEIGYPVYCYRINPSGISKSEKQLEDSVLNMYEIYKDSLNYSLPISDLAGAKCYSLLVVYIERILILDKSKRPQNFNQYYQRFRCIKYKKIKGTWGLRHKMMFVVLKYLPLLWRIKSLRHFCTKNGTQPRFI